MAVIRISETAITPSITPNPAYKRDETNTVSRKLPIISQMPASTRPRRIQTIAVIVISAERNKTPT